MGAGFPPKNWPFPPPPPPTNALGTLLGGRNVFPIAPTGNALATLAGSAAPQKPNALATLAGLAMPPPTAGFSAPSLFGNPSPPLGLGALSLLNAPPPPVFNWQYVRGRFNRFLANLAITPAQREDGKTKHAGVRACLNRHYWDTQSETANSLLIGSWGKGTQVRPPRDVDILFLLPGAVYHRFQRRDGNRQSQLLQEVKDALAETYSQTTMRGDGQVICIPFNSMPVELSPGFRCDDGSIIICDTNGGGRYKTSTTKVEELELSASDTRWSGTTRALVRMLKQWQREHNVPLRSFVIERLAVHFLDVWPHSHRDVFWYDWMMRDFFGWLLKFVNGTLTMPVTSEVIPLGNEWQVRAERAYKNAVSACENEYGNYQALAGDDWQKIFGPEIPVLVL